MQNDDITVLPLNDTEHYFYSSDFDEATALYAMGCPVVGIDSTKTRSIFIFENEDGIEDISKAYWACKLPIDALRLATARRTLKSRLYKTKTVRC